MRRVREAPAGALLCAAIAAARGGAAAVKLQKVADGVYAALATPRSPIDCNAAVVVVGDGVLVVDTHSRPSSARALIAQIRSVTDQPVRFAVNTHFHWDHARQPCLSGGVPEAGRDRGVRGRPRICGRSAASG